MGEGGKKGAQRGVQKSKGALPTGLVSQHGFGLTCLGLCCCAGISGFSNVNQTDIEAALPILKRNGVPYLIHAEIPEDIPTNVSHHTSLMMSLSTPPDFVPQSHNSMPPSWNNPVQNTVCTRESLLGREHVGKRIMAVGRYMYQSNPPHLELPTNAVAMSSSFLNMRW